MTTTKKNYFTIAMWFSAILFLLLYLILGWNNRPAADDLYYLGNCPDKGIYGCMKYLYVTYSGRWSAYLFTGTIISLSHFKGALVLFHLATLCSLISVIALILHQLICLNGTINIKKSTIALYAIILTEGFFFTSYSIGETWFWIVQVCTYLWTIIMSLVILYAMIGTHSKTVATLIMVPAALFIGGSSESYALIDLFILISVCFWANNHRIRKKIAGLPSLKNLNYKLFLAIAALSIGFIITMAAPGNKVRYEALPHPSIIVLLGIQIKSWIKILLIRTPLKLPLLLLFGAPWMLAGIQYQNPINPISFPVFLKKTLPWLVLILTLIFVFLIPTCFIMSETGPDRALSMISFLIMAGFSALFFSAGVKIRSGTNFQWALKTGLSTIMIATLSFFILTQYPITSAYARSYDQRMQTLKTLKIKSTGEPCILKPLAPSGMLYSAEITTDPAHFKNRFLQGVYDLKCNVAIPGASPSSESSEK